MPLAPSETVYPSETLYPSSVAVYRYAMYPSETLYPSQDLLPTGTESTFVDSGAALGGDSTLAVLQTLARKNGAVVSGTVTITAAGNVIWSEGAALVGAGSGSLPKAFLIVAESADLEGSALIEAEAIVGRSYIVPSEDQYPGMEVFPSAGNAPDAVNFEAHLIGAAVLDIMGSAAASLGASINGITDVGSDYLIAVSSAADIDGVAEVLVGVGIVDAVIVLTSTADLEVWATAAYSSGSHVTSKAYSEAEFPQGMRAAHKTMYEAGVD